MSEFRLTVTPRTDHRASAAPSSGSAVRTAQPAFQSGPTGPTDGSRTPTAVQPATQSGPTGPGVKTAPALPSVVQKADAA